MMTAMRVAARCNCDFPGLLLLQGDLKELKPLGSVKSAAVHGSNLHKPTYLHSTKKGRWTEAKQLFYKSLVHTITFSHMNYCIACHFGAMPPAI